MSERVLEMLSDGTGSGLRTLNNANDKAVRYIAGFSSVDKSDWILNASSRVMAANEARSGYLIRRASRRRYRRARTRPMYAIKAVTASAGETEEVSIAFELVSVGALCCRRDGLDLVLKCLSCMKLKWLHGVKAGAAVVAFQEAASGVASEYLV